MDSIVKKGNILITFAFLLGLFIGWATEHRKTHDCPSHHYLRGNCLTQAYVDSHAAYH